MAEMHKLSPCTTYTYTESVRKIIKCEYATKTRLKSIMVQRLISHGESKKKKNKQKNIRLIKLQAYKRQNLCAALVLHFFMR